MLVEKRMSRPAITISPETSLQDALDLMHVERVRRLPVVDRKGKLVGIIAERDLLKASPSSATTLSKFEMKTMVRKLKIKEFMSVSVATVTEDTPVEEAARIMTDGQISGLPVVRGEKVVGVITETDIFKVFLEMFGARQAGIRIAFLLPKEPGQLAGVSRAIADAGGNIIALGTFLGETSKNAEITMKIDLLEQGEVVKILTPLVEKILDVRTMSGI
ncbi:MAG: CBS and ACT domain-containing protein [Anaerolineaceae bacterium]|nr:CBS and ACT domain-containing protein [Anaerolineaceae bacterium]